MSGRKKSENKTAVELSKREQEKISACIMIQVLNDEKEATKLDGKNVLSEAEEVRLSAAKQRSEYYRALVKKINGDPSSADEWEKRLEIMRKFETKGARTSSKPKTTTKARASSTPKRTTAKQTTVRKSARKK